MYRTLLILLAVVAVLTVVVRLLRTNWRSVGKRARETAADAAATGRQTGARWGESGREAAGALAERAGDVVKERAADLSSHREVWRDKAADVADGLGNKPAERLAGLLERTFVVAAPATQVAPVVAAAMRRAPLFDAVAAQAAAGPGAPAGAGEVAAYVYEALGTVRLVVTADPRDPGRAMVGVARYEVVMGDPQGGPATEHALDEIHAELESHGLAVEQVQRRFTDADGIRWAAPLD